MLKIIRNSLCSRILWGFMAVYMLNICVDVPNATLQNVPEDLSINDQESVIEIIVEKILGYDDVIAEYDDNDAGDQTVKKVSEKNYAFPKMSVARFNILPLFAHLDVPRNSGLPATGFMSLESPPPKA